jgi:hypothetical protein
MESKFKVDPTVDKRLEREIYYTGNYEIGRLSVFRTGLNNQFKDWNIHRLRKGKARISGLIPFSRLDEMRHADNLFAIPKVAERNFPSSLFA